MNLSKSQRFAALVMVAVLSVGVGACGSDDDADGKGADTETETNGSAAAEGDSPNMTVEDNDRAFGATDDMIEETLKKVTEVDDVTWEGSQVQLTFTEGSIEDSGAWSPCISAGAVLGEDETALLRYPDGDLDCETSYEDRARG